MQCKSSSFCLLRKQQKIGGIKPPTLDEHPYNACAGSPLSAEANIYKKNKNNEIKFGF